MKRTAGVMMAHLLVLAAALSGCGRENGVGSGDAERTAPPQTELTITVTPSPEAPPREWTLRCEPPGGTHPAPDAACAALHETADPFAPVPPDAVCTQIYGGPQEATITGVWRGEQVRASYDRTNGCEISRWDAIEAVLQPQDVSPGSTR